MLRILVAHSYFLRFDEKQLQRAKPYPPLATLQVATSLRRSAHEVAFFDAMLADGVGDFVTRLHAHQPDLVVFYEDNYNFLSKMCLGRMRQACCQMIRASAGSGARVVTAGSDASDAPEVYLEAGTDAVLLGEGLATLAALISRIDNDRAIPVAKLCSGLPGVVVTGTDDSNSLTTALPGSGTELPERPAWDFIDIASYRDVWMRAHGYFSLNMAASRGCSFRCNWCAKPIWGNQYLQRDAARVAAEMLYLKQQLGADHIWFADDIFGFKCDWVETFARLLDESGGGLPFTIQLRADLVSPRMASALAAAGCREVWLGAESGSQKILDAMNKGTSVGTILNARRMLGEHGIRVGFFLMLGYIDETLEDIIATRDLVTLAHPDDVGVSVAYPLPGTKFFERVSTQLGEKRNWQQSNDLEMIFAGAYRSEFYHIIRDLLHDQVADGWSQTLEKRWLDLVERELDYRQAPQATARSGLRLASAR